MGALMNFLRAVCIFLYFSSVGFVFADGYGYRQPKFLESSKMVVCVIADGSVGAGFIVLDGVVATALHTVIGAESVSIVIAGKSTPVFEEDVFVRDDFHDIILYKIDTLGIKPLQLSSNILIKGIYGEVYGIAQTGKLSGSAGILNRYQDEETIIFNMSVKEGLSGGPLVLLKEKTVVVGGMLVGYRCLGDNKTKVAIFVSGTHIQKLLNK